MSYSRLRARAVLQRVPELSHRRLLLPEASERDPAHARQERSLPVVRLQLLTRDLQGPERIASERLGLGNPCLRQFGVRVDAEPA